MHKKFLYTIAALAIAAFSTPVLAMNDTDDDPVNSRSQTVTTQLEVHYMLNEINGSSSPTFSKAINETTDAQIKEYFGDLDVTRQDLRDLNDAANQAKHVWPTKQ